MSETATPSALEKRVAAIEERQEHVATKGAISLLGTDIRTHETGICAGPCLSSPPCRPSSFCPAWHRS